MKTIDQLQKIKYSYSYSMFINKNVLNSFEEHSSRLLDSIALNLGHKLGRTLILKITKFELRRELMVKFSWVDMVSYGLLD